VQVKQQQLFWLGFGGEDFIQTEQLGKKLQDDWFTVYL
jgi:hypothetical protein